MKKIIEGKQSVNLNTAICRYLLHYRSTPQTTTNKSPAELLFKHRFNTRLNLIKQSLDKQDLDHERKIVDFYTSKKLRTFYPGESVWYRNFQQGNKWKKGTIIEQTSPVTYLIDNNCNIFQKYVDQLYMYCYYKF